MVAHRSGFTLIELAIVLVIIGLVVGGVMVGKDLIEAASIRATVSQYGQYNLAVNTFKLKYNSLPGDMATPKARAMGFLYVTPLYTNVNHGVGNGNGIIQDRRGAGNDGVNMPEGETIIFWRHLTDAKLIDGSYSAALANNTGAYPGEGGCTGLPSCDPYEFFPQAKARKTMYWLPGYSGGQHYYVLGAVSAVISNGQYYQYTASNAFTPNEAYAIDSKLDDGMPNTGIVQARVNISGIGNNGNDLVFTSLSAATAGTFATTPVNGTCQTGGASSTDTANFYASNSTTGNSPACNLRLRFN